MMDVILYIGISQFVFAALLTFTKRRVLFPDKLLGLWLILMAIFMGLTLAKSVAPDGFWGRLQLFPFFFTIGPFLFQYVRGLAAEKEKLEFVDSLHLLPFAIFSTAAVMQFYSVDEDFLSGDLFNINMLVYSISAIVSFFYYIGITFTVLRRHRKKILDHFSYQSRKISLNWVKIVNIVISTTLFVTVMVTLVNFFVGVQLLNPGIPLFLGFTIFAFGVSFFGVRQPAIFANAPKVKDERYEDDLEEAAQKEQEQEIEPQKKYERSGLREQQANGYTDKLMTYLDTEKPYLRRDLTIQDVAEDLHIPPHHLTQTINEYLGKNFYTLINEYRIKEVKNRLLDKKYNHLTVLAIAHDAGFNSKSSFNMTFKRYVGMTPSEYKRSQKAK